MSSYRCINYCSSWITSGDPRSTRPPLRFTMSMAMPVSMVTCPPNTLAHQCCPHEGKLCSLVSRCKTQTRMQMQGEKIVTDIWNTLWSIRISPDLSDCIPLSTEEHGISPFPDDAKDMSVHHSVCLWYCERASVCNSSHGSPFPSSGQWRLIELPRAVQYSWTEKHRQHVFFLHGIFSSSSSTWFNS